MLRPAPASLPTRIVMSVDVPSAATATGTALVLDGEDAGLVRASLVDADGALFSRDLGYTVAFTVVSGPGLVFAAVSGDPSSANATNRPTGSPTARAYGGMASCIVKVTRDCTSEHRDLIRYVNADRRVVSQAGRDGDSDSDGNAGGDGGGCELSPIVLRATATRSAGSPALASASVEIAVSVSFGRDSAEAVATREHAAATQGRWGYLANFVG